MIVVLLEEGDVQKRRADVERAIVHACHVADNLQSQCQYQNNYQADYIQGKTYDGRSPERERLQTVLRVARLSRGCGTRRRGDELGARPRAEQHAAGMPYQPLGRSPASRYSAAARDCA